MVMRYAQLFFKRAGGTSCYADCIIRLASKITKTEPTLTYYASCFEKGIDAGYIRFNQKNYLQGDNFYVEKPAEFLSLLTGKRFTVSHEPASYRPKEGEWYVNFWAKTVQQGKNGTGHFCLEDYDPLDKSVTRLSGLVYSRRVFREVK